MYFFIDESGHTGNNLLDKDQPVFYYGMLSSRVNLDVVAKTELNKIKMKLGIKHLHGSSLSENRLAQLVPSILKLSRQFDLRFHIFRIVKSDYIIITFFDQIFDPLINKAVDSSVYSGDLRNQIISGLAKAFDEECLKKAWLARIELESEKSKELLVDVFETLIRQLPTNLDQTLSVPINKALKWAQENPESTQYNVAAKDDLLLISPNLIGFQFVLDEIATKLSKQSQPASKIIVDQQIQFNSAQQTLLDLYRTLSQVKPEHITYGLPNVSLKNLPEIPITPANSKISVGLELTDLLLWVFQRHFENKLSPSLIPIIKSQLQRGKMNELSIRGLSQ